MRLFKFFKQFCQRLRSKGERTPSLPQFLLALRDGKLAIYIDENRGLCLAGNFKNPWVVPHSNSQDFVDFCSICEYLQACLEQRNQWFRFLQWFYFFLRCGTFGEPPPLKTSPERIKVLLGSYIL